MCARPTTRVSSCVGRSASTRTTVRRARSRSISGSPASAPNGWREHDRASRSRCWGRSGRRLSATLEHDTCCLLPAAWAWPAFASLADEALAERLQRHGAVRRRERRSGLSELSPARRGRVRRCDRRRQLRPQGLRDRARAAVRGVGRSVFRMRATTHARGARARRGWATGTTWRCAPGQSPRFQERAARIEGRAGGARGCRSAWNRTWAAPSARASAAL